MDNILIIHSRDNVGVALKAIAKGKPVVAGGKEIFSALEEIPASHKVALHDIDKGEEIIKYGEPVAVSTQAIRQGQWVHTHNLESKMWKK
ncbi:MAG: UxaA family hydrolase [Smithella sp.]